MYGTYSSAFDNTGNCAVMYFTCWVLPAHTPSIILPATHTRTKSPCYHDRGQGNVPDRARRPRRRHRLVYRVQVGGVAGAGSKRWPPRHTATWVKMKYDILTTGAAPTGVARNVSAMCTAHCGPLCCATERCNFVADRLVAP